MKLPGFLKARESVTIILAAAFILVVGIFSPSFLAFSNLTRILNATVILVVLAAGEAMVIISRNIDVSIGSTLALTGICAGLMMGDGVPVPMVVLITVIFGALLGTLNGIGVTYGHIPSIVMTLGTMGAYRGIGFIITGGNSVESIPEGFKKMGVEKFLGVPMLVWVALVLLVFIGLFLARTRIGRHLYATGDNAQGAMLIGVRTNAMTIMAFTFSGALASIAGLVFLAQIGSMSNQAGVGIEMRAVAASVIGGVALTGGVGSILGASFGALFITAATSSLSFLGIPGFWGDTVIGAILLVALFADARVRKTLEKRRLEAKYARVARAAEDADAAGSASTTKEVAR